MPPHGGERKTKRVVDIQRREPFDVEQIRSREQWTSRLHWVELIIIRVGLMVLVVLGFVALFALEIEKIVSILGLK